MPLSARGCDVPLFAGFDLGGTELKYGLLDERNRLVFKDTAQSPHRIKDLLELFGELWQELNRIERKTIRAAGFGIPGIFSLEDQRILQSPNYPELDNYPFRSALARVVDVPFWLDNDANMAAYGEFRCGAGRGVKHMILLTLGTGVGSGIIIDGELIHGACGFAAEMGHTIVNPDGDRCKCGSRGCLETEAAAGPIVRNYRQFTGSSARLAAEDVARKARSGNRAARRSFYRAARYLGIALGSAINFLNPEKILLGGGVMSSGGLLLPGAVKEASRRCYPAAFACCSIENARLKNDAGFMGAAAWAKDRFVKRRG